ncbi:MAG: carbohydrate porin [Chthoniobacterales bacterium]|nr:carbohydrate porin [Chthoniobacterales bacterium]
MKNPKHILSAVVVMAAASAHAMEDRFWDYYTPYPSNFIGSAEWWRGDDMTGDWWGMRNWLDSEKGVEFSGTYTTDLAGNPVGGMQQGFTYTDNIAFGVKLDLEKLVGWRGATFTIAATDRNGDSLSQDFIGNQFTVQQIYGGQTIILTDVHLVQKFWDDKANIKIGRFSAGDDFASSPLYWLYMNNGIDGNPQSIPVNASFSAYPWASWAARLRVDPTPDWNAQLGLYQVSNRTFSRSLNGLNMGIEPTDGVMFVGQLGWTPEFFKRHVKRAPTELEEVEGTEQAENDVHGLPGHYWFGGYYSTWSSYAQFGSTQTAPNAYGFYWHADQKVYEETLGSDEGLTLWSAFVLSPQQNMAKLPFQWNSGIVYQGLLPGRDNDSAIFGLAYGNFSSDYSNSGGAYNGDPASFEMALEWGYHIQLNRFFYVQPDLQYIIQPGGTGSTPNALVLGAQIGVTF